MPQPSIITGKVPGFPPETAANQSPSTARTMAILWLAICFFQLALGIGRLTSHRPVSTLRCVGLVFWAALTLFWAWQLVLALRRLRKQRAEQPYTP